MHWLTWHQIVDFVTTWQGLTLTIAGVVAAIYYGPRRMLETWDWYWDRFRDGEVLIIFHRRKFMPPPSGQSNFGPAHTPIEIPYTAAEIAGMLGRSKKSVVGSIKRLWRRGKLEMYGSGWRAK